MNSRLLMIFAKAPVAGYAKQRLIPVLGADGAADLHKRLIRHTLSTAMSTGILTELWCAPDTSHPFFDACAADYPITLHNQTGNDLGERMYNAFADTPGRVLSSVIIGCDSPALTPGMITDAFYLLDNGNDAVIGPAEDGGYFLIGLTRPEPYFFSAIPWGTGAVLEHTRERMRTFGSKWKELPSLWDVDRPEDLVRLRSIENFSKI